MSSPLPEFDYDQAFSRNLGWITAWEQQVLRGKRVAIAGMGGVGGYYVQTFARLGVGALSIADFDRFELANFNRQAGAGLSTIGRAKIEVMAAQARDINPNIEIRAFPEGIGDTNIDVFLDDADLFVDGLDFFVLDVRARLFARSRARGIPAITAAPVGMGVAYLTFMPGRMSFEDYFRIDGLSADRQQVNMLVGLNPKGLHRSYLIDPYRVDFARKRAPSTVMACELCAGVVGTEAVKILLGRGDVRPAPWYRHFDAYLGKWASGRLRWGNHGPLQTLKRQIGYRQFARLSADSWPEPEADGSRSTLERILDLARWAPSGDNTQPWRFQIEGDDRLGIEITTSSTAENVYEYNGGQPTLLSAGCLLETLRIAASRFGRTLSWHYSGAVGRTHRIEVRFAESASLATDPLCSYLRIRSVDRRPYQTMPLTRSSKDALEGAIGDDLEIRWFESSRDRWRMALLNAIATDIRLRIPEAYAVHRRILDWDRRFSPHGVPVKAVGLGPTLRAAMRHAMKSWSKMAFVNRFLAGTLLPKIQLDLVPGLFCAAHFAICWKTPVAPEMRLESLLRAGERVQRFWLTATRFGLAVQPALATHCFAVYGIEQHAFTGSPVMHRRAEFLADSLLDAFDISPHRLVFIGRIGRSSHVGTHARSVRRSTAELINHRRSRGAIIDQ